MMVHGGAVGVMVVATPVEEEEVMVEVAAVVENKVCPSMALTFLTKLIISVQTNTANSATTVVDMSK